MADLLILFPNFHPVNMEKCLSWLILVKMRQNPEMKIMDVDLVVFEETNWWLFCKNYCHNIVTV